MVTKRPHLKHTLGVSALGLTALTANQAHGMETPRLEHPPVLSQREISPEDFLFKHDHVLGTSLELIVRSAHAGDADECEMQVLGEIERLRGILSTYDQMSEIRQYMAGGAAASPELEDVLAAYDHWSELTGGALNINMADVIGLWKKAGLEGQLPDRSALREALHAPRAINVDALGKGYIIDRAVEVAQGFVGRGLLNIGGDIRVWGGDTWLIGVANPAKPFENAQAVAQFELRDAAAATSGGYMRFYPIGGKRFSHLIDPRTQWATPDLVSATVVAADCVSANALSTAACVLGLEGGVKLVLRQASEYLMTDSAGTIRSSAGFIATAIPGALDASATSPSPDAKAQPSASAKVAPAAVSATDPQSTSAAIWPKDFQATINLTLKSQGLFGRFGGRHPYVAIWVEDTKKKLVRTITVWGNSYKYLRELSGWLGMVGPNINLRSITHATRPAGQYSVVWDGMDDKGKPVPAGDYRIVVEINRENGTHVKESALLHCADTAQSAALPDTAESTASKIEYGPKTTADIKAAGTPSTAATAPQI
jgi:thiamine biosynthesis lipoprotein